MAFKAVNSSETFEIMVIWGLLGLCGPFWGIHTATKGANGVKRVMKGDTQCSTIL